MATIIFSSTIVFLVALCLAGVPVYSDTNTCDISSNVSLSSPTEVCPSKPVTVQCNVTKPQDGGNFLLAWECTDPGGADVERLVFCDRGPVAEISCAFGEVYDVAGDCICNDTVITSVATFNTTSMCDKLLLCGNGGAEKKQVSVTINGLNAPVMSENYTEVERDNGIYDVTVWWTKGDCAPDDVMYNLTVTDMSHQESVNYSTQQTQYTLPINRGVNYTATVVAQLCNGNLMSNPSNGIFLFIPNTPTTMHMLTTSTPVTMTSKPTESSDTRLIVGVTVPAAFIFGVIIVICIIIVLCFMKKWLHPGIEEVDAPPKRSGVAGLYVDSEYIYYSCTETHRPNENKYVLKRSKEDGKVVDCSIPSNSFIRGIGQNNGFLYVLCSATDSQVIKVDCKEWIIVDRSNVEFGEDFGLAYGMLVTSDNVIVCSKDNKKIYVLNLELNKIRFYFELDFNPISIAKFEDHFIVTAETLIAIIDIDFAGQTGRTIVELKNFIKGQDTVSFNEKVVLRSICASDKYMYVTQKETKGPGWPMLCLEYDKERCKLNYVCEVSDFQERNCNECNERCGPIVVYYNNNTIFYSQGSYEKKFHIVKATHNPEEPIKSTKMFDVM